MFLAPGGTACVFGHGGVDLVSSCQDSNLREGHVLTYVVVWRPCYKFGSYFDTVFIRRYAVCLSWQRSVPSSTKAPSTGRRQSGEICQAFYTEAFTSFCQTYDRAICSNLPGHHCLLPPHVVEDCSVFSSFFVLMVASAIVFSMFPVLLAWHCALPLLSLVATGKPLTRWRLALAQEAARGTSPSSSLWYF